MEINALKNKPVTLINYSDKRSTNAATLLCEADFCDVGVLHDGMKRWNQNGLAPRDRFEGQLNAAEYRPARWRDRAPDPIPLQRSAPGTAPLYDGASK
jgi:hypothetical protein